MDAHTPPGDTTMELRLTKSGLGRVRNNIHKVLYYVVHDLRHTRMYLKCLVQGVVHAVVSEYHYPVI